MKIGVFSIRDRAADVFGRPFCAPSAGVAVRTFSDMVNTPAEGNNFNKHPEDFDLYELGEYSDGDGMFNTGVPKMIAIGKDLKV